DQRADVGRYGRPARAASALPGPEQAEAAAVPVDAVSGLTRTKLIAIGVELVAIRAARTPRMQRQILPSSARRSSRRGPPSQAPRAEDIRSRSRRAPQSR